MNPPYENPGFQNSAEFTVAVTFVVEGGKRPLTADGRARRIFERIVNHTARLKDVLEVTAVGGPSHEGEILWRRPVAFTAANTGSNTLERGKLLRYLDPEYERAKRALSAVNEAARLKREADHRRRSSLGCANAYPSALGPSRRSCDCAYCQPEEHLLAARRPREVQVGRLTSARCLCGQAVQGPRQRCPSHLGSELELLDGDPPSLRLLADWLTAS